MSNYKNPYVRLERLSSNVIDRFLSTTHSSLKQQIEETDEEITDIIITDKEKESLPRRTKIEETDEEITDIIITDEEKESLPRRTKLEETDEDITDIIITDEEKESLPRRTKQNVKTYRLESISENESSEVKVSDLGNDSNHSDELNPNSKQNVKTYCLESSSQDESYDVKVSDLENDSNHSDELNPNSKSGEKRQRTSKSEKKNGKKRKTGKVEATDEEITDIIITDKEKESLPRRTKTEETDEEITDIIIIDAEKESLPRRTKIEETDEEVTDIIITDEEKESLPRRTKLEETDEEITDIIITDEEKESLPRRTKKNVKTYRLESISENESSDVKVSDLGNDSNHSDESDVELTPNSKPERKTGRPSRSAKQKVKTYCIETASKDESSDYEESDHEGDSNYSNESDFELNRRSKQNVKRNRFESASEDESSDDEESDLEGDSNCSNESDFEFNPYSKSEKKKGKKQKTGKSEKKKGKKRKTGKVKELTEYEKLILKNNNEKNAFLDSLRINEVKDGFTDAIEGYQNVGKRKWERKPKPVIVPRLKIERSSKVDTDLSEEAIAARRDSIDKKILQAIEKKEIVRNLPTRLHLKDALQSDQSYQSFLHDLKDLDQGNTEPIHKCIFKDTEMLESHIEHFGPTKLEAMDIHPMRENTIIAAGGTNGKLYLWNINSKPYAFEVHDSTISHLKFNPENSHLITCTSNDGTLGKGDLVANVYKMVTNDTNCTYFDFLSPDTYLVSHRDGYVSVVDMREARPMNRKRRVTHQCRNGCIRSVSVHPVNKNEFITPSSKGCVRLWDLRKLQEDPVIEALHGSHNTELQSAIFSPLTGKSVLTSSRFGKICWFNTSSWSTDPSCIHSLLRRNTGCRATWQPRTDRKFAVGSRICPRSIDIYNFRQRIFSYSHEWLKGAISFCTFHPSLPIIAAVENSTVSVFANKDP